MDPRLRSFLRTVIFTLVPVFIVILARPELTEYLHIDPNLAVILTMVVGAVARAFARPGELPEVVDTETGAE